MYVKHLIMKLILTENELVRIMFDRIGYFLGVTPMVDDSINQKCSKKRKLYIIAIIIFFFTLFMISHILLIDTIGMFYGSRYKLVCGLFEIISQFVSGLISLFLNLTHEEIGIFFQKLSQFDKTSFGKVNYYKRFQITATILITWLVINMSYNNISGYFLIGEDYPSQILCYECLNIYCAFQILVMCFLVEILENRYDFLNKKLLILDLYNMPNTAALTINKLCRDYRCLNEIVENFNSYFGPFTIAYISYSVMYVDYWFSQSIVEDFEIDDIIRSFGFPPMHCVSSINSK